MFDNIITTEEVYTEGLQMSYNLHMTWLLLFPIEKKNNNNHKKKN